MSQFRPENSSRPSKRRRTHSYKPTGSKSIGESPVLSDEPSDDLPRGSVKTKKERRTNPSTRIHSLRRLLQRDSEKLPATVRQEKERELAALLLDQEKTRVAQANKKNLIRYHKVRFVERKKAQRLLSQHIRRRDAGDYDGPAGLQRLEKLIHTAEVDINYTQYAPLGQKYISIFAEDRPKRKRDHSKDNQDEESQQANDEQSNILPSSGGAKPPMWYEVEKAMKIGQARLDALRNGKLNNTQPIDRELASVGGKKSATESSKEQPADSNKPGKSKKRTPNDSAMDDADDDSDGDGGFFER